VTNSAPSSFCLMLTRSRRVRLVSG